MFRYALPSFLSLVYFSCAFAGKETVAAESKPFLTPLEHKKSCNPGPASRIALRYRAPEDFGYNDGFTTLAFFISPTWQRPFQPFVDLRGHIFNDGRWAANAGLGGRFSFCGEKILGFNAYYDYRDSKELGSQNQVGGGFEFLSKWADIRINGYAPLGKTTKADSPCFDCFSCHTAIARQQVYASLADIDGEVGFYLPGPMRYVDLYFAAGPYYLFEKEVAGATLGGDWGGRARLSLMVWDGVELGGNVTYDPIFKTNGQGYVTVSWPFGPANSRRYSKKFEEKYPSPCDETARHFARMTQDVYRNEIIPIESKTHRFDLCCNLPCAPKIYFVNNCNCLPGSGTFEQPYNCLDFAQHASKEGDIIYVFPGDGTNKNMDGGFVMKDCQRLISSATSFDLCNVCIPALTPNCKPHLDNIRNIISTAISPLTAIHVTMANCSEVAGFIFDGIQEEILTFVPIAVSIDNGKKFLIRNNTILNVTDGIHRLIPLTNGDITICNNSFEKITNDAVDFSQATTIENTTMRILCNEIMSSVNALQLANANNLALTFDQNILNSVGSFGIFGGEITNSTFCINGNCVKEIGTGMVLTSVFNTGSYTFSNNCITDYNTFGTFNPQGTNANFVYANNVFSNGPQSAIQIGALTNSRALFCNNEISNVTQTVGIVFFGATNSDLSFQGNAISNTGGSGISLLGTTTGGSLEFNSNQFDKAARAILSTSNDNTKITVKCNRVMNSTSTEDFDFQMVQGSSSFCMINNTFERDFLSNFANDACLRLAGNKTDGAYNIINTAALHVESPDLTEAGVQSLNQGTVMFSTPPTFIEEGTCGCSACPCNPCKCNPCLCK